MKRRLFFLERLLYGDGKTPFHAVFPVRLKGLVSVADLRTALAKIQKKHPLLQSRISEDKSGIPYFVMDGSVGPIPIRIAERHAGDDWIKESKREWNVPFDLEKGPLIRIVWMQSDSATDILMTFHHCICNGSSCLLLMQEILALLDEPGTNIGHYSHFITPEEILAENRPDKRTERVIKWKTRIAGAFICCRAALILKKKPGVCRDKDYLINWKLDKSQSTAIIQACRQRNITVNTALCAAFITAFHAVKGKKRYPKLTCPVDIRRFLPVDKREELFSFGLAITLSLQDQGKDFWDNAAALQQDAAEKMQKLNAGDFLLPLEMAHPLFRPLMKTLRHGPRKTNLILSNLGRLDIRKQYRSFQVEAVSSPTVIGSFGDPTDIVTTTFDGQMDFCFLSNEEFLPYSDAMAIRNNAMALLLPNYSL